MFTVFLQEKVAKPQITRVGQRGKPANCVSMLVILTKNMVFTESK